MIKTLEMTGYRLLESFRADFEQLTVVIGANATGKSTLLDCLQFIAQCAEFPLDTVTTWHGGAHSLLSAATTSRELGWKLTFQKSIAHPVWQHQPLDENRPFVYEVNAAVDPLGQVQPTYEVLRNADPHPGHDEPFKLLETTPYRSNIFDHKRKKLVPFDEVVTSAPSEETELGISEGEPPNGNPLIPTQPKSLRLAQMRFLNEYPEPSWLRFLIANCYFYPGFDVGRSSAVRCKPAEIKAVTMLDPTGQNLGTVLHEILTRHAYRVSADALREFLRSAYPSFNEISAETSYSGSPTVLVRIHESAMSRPIELYEISDGMLRFLCLAAALLNPLPPALLAIDEPEAGLHPRLLPIVADMIKTAAEKTQVLVTTHSPDLLNCFELADVAVLARDESGVTWNRPATRKTLCDMLQSVAGETLGDLHKSGELEALP